MKEDQVFSENIRRYADLIVRHGLNLQRGQLLNISAEACHRDFVNLVVEAAYKVGASIVNVDLIDPRFQRTRILTSADEYLEHVPDFIQQKFKELVDTSAANLKIVGPEYPEILSDLDAKAVNRIRKAQFQAAKYFYSEGIERAKIHWCVVAAPTHAWAARLFPGESSDEALRKLWNEIIKACRADRADYLQAWINHNALLQSRAKRLTELKIDTLHFVGPGTDLKVGLSELALFRGGSEPGPRGVDFEPNLPTEECFTTPDYRKTEGIATATRPFLVNGKLIKGLVMTFKGGEIVDFSCQEGHDTFKEYIDSDPGARRLGEVALVGTDSPIFQSGIVFEEILFDENAACHIAVGVAYKICLKNGPTLTEDQLREVGCNESSVHTDMMISSENVDVFANLRNGETIKLIEKGSWCGEFSIKK